jgi:threonine dehydrogenase-like Zn-dependent dehydrogenase
MLLSRNVATFVYSLEPADSARARLVRAMGGHYLSGRDVALGELRRKIGPVDLVYEAVGNAAVAFGAIPVLAPNGVFILTGVPAPGKTVSMDLGAVMRGIVLGNQVLFGTVNAARSTFEEAVGELKMFMVEFPEAVRELISERVALEDAPALLHQAPQGIKQVVVLAEPS